MKKTLIFFMILVVTPNFLYADWFDDYKKKEISLYYPSIVEKIIKKFPALQFFDEYIHWTSGIRFIKAHDKETKQKYFLWKEEISFGNSHEQVWYLGKTKEWSEKGILNMLKQARTLREERDKNIIKIEITND